jgi:hypothetical protein
MAGYVALFGLKRSNTKRNYKALVKLIEEIDSGPRLFGGDQMAVPYAILFHSQEAQQLLLDRFQEHTYPGDEILLLRVSGGSAALADGGSREELRAFLSGL